MTYARPLNRRFFLLTATAFVLAAPAHADFVTEVQRKLQSQGFTEISVSYTLLGRSRILARNNRGMREIILNPKTGEVLRDLWTSANGETEAAIFGTNTDAHESEDIGDDGDSDSDGGKGHSQGGDDGDGASHDSESDGDSGGDDND